MARVGDCTCPTCGRTWTVVVQIAKGRWVPVHGQSCPRCGASLRIATVARTREEANAPSLKLQMDIIDRTAPMASAARAAATPTVQQSEAAAPEPAAVAPREPEPATRIAQPQRDRCCYMRQLDRAAIWTESHGPIPAGKRIGQTCSTPYCGRLDHMQLVDDGLSAKADWSRQRAAAAKLSPGQSVIVELPGQIAVLRKLLRDAHGSGAFRVADAGSGRAAITKRAEQPAENHDVPAAQQDEAADERHGGQEPDGSDVSARLAHTLDALLAVTDWSAVPLAKKLAIAAEVAR